MTRLGNFQKFFTTNFTIILARIFIWQLFGLFGSMSLFMEKNYVGYLSGMCWKIWATFISTIRSHCLIRTLFFWKNMGQSRPLFVYFRSFLIPTTISIIQIEKSVDGVLGIRTRGRRMVDVDDTTELWRHPIVCSNRILSPHHCLISQERTCAFGFHGKRKLAKWQKNVYTLGSQAGVETFYFMQYLGFVFWHASILESLGV